MFRANCALCYMFDSQRKPALPFLGHLVGQCPLPNDLQVVFGVTVKSAAHFIGEDNWLANTIPTADPLPASESPFGRLSALIFHLTIYCNSWKE